jgi:proteasome activator subunit 4
MPKYHTVHESSFDSQLSWCLGYIAGNSRKFFHPAAIEDMLSTFVPLMDGTNLDVRSCTLYSVEPATQKHHIGYAVLSILLTELSSSFAPPNILIDVVPGVGGC